MWPWHKGANRSTFLPIHHFLITWHINYSAPLMSPGLNPGFGSISALDLASHEARQIQIRGRGLGAEVAPPRPLEPIPGFNPRSSNIFRNYFLESMWTSTSGSYWNSDVANMPRWNRLLVLWVFSFERQESNWWMTLSGGRVESWEYFLL